MELSTLKRNQASGLLRSIKKYRDWLEYAYDNLPSRKSLARDCGCCELLPTDVLPGALVDTGEKQTVTGVGSASFTGFFTEGYGSFQERFVPQVSWNWGGVGGSEAALYPPLQLIPPAGFAVHPVYGTNLNWCLVLSATLGGATETFWHEYIEPGDPPPTSGSVEASVNFGARLFAYIEEVGRQVQGGQIWGPRPRYSDPQTKDAVDLRGYKSAKLDWYYWDRDAGGGSVTVSAFGHSLTVMGSGPPAVVGAGSVSMQNIEPRVQDEQGEWQESSLSMSFFGSQELPEMTRSAYAAPPDDNGAIARTGGNTVYIKCDGVNTSTFRRASLSLWDIQAPREIDIVLEVETPHGAPCGPFDVIPYDGPDRTALGGHAYPVNTHFPVDDPWTGVDEGVEISLAGPGNWSGTGISYGAGASGFINAGSGWNPFGVMDESLNTIGAPAFGFVYDPTSLEAAGVSGDNWRCPLGIPVAAASWEAARLRVRRQARLPESPAWSAGSGTTIDGNAVTGPDTLTISQILSDAWLIRNYRWLVIRLAGSQIGQTITLTIGAKSWARTLPTSEGDVVFDLCNPTNGSGFDATSSVLEVRAAQGGWGWGVDGGATLTLQTDAPFWVWDTRLEASGLPGLLLVGETLHRWISPFEVGEITLNEGRVYEETITTYATRGLLYLHDGRVVLDEEWGLTADGFSWQDPDYRAVMALNIGDVIRAASVRQGNSAPAAVALLEDRKPARFYERVGWDGAFRWVAYAEFFNNQVEAYHLRPARAVVSGNTVSVMADYCVDRIAPGVGVSCEIKGRKWLGGGLHGLTVVGGDAVSSAVSAGGSDTVSRSDGLYVLPGDELLASNQDYSVSAGWDGSPSGAVVEGTLMRVCVRKT